MKHSWGKLVVLLGVVCSSLVGPAARADIARRSGAPEYQADFSRSDERGVGARFAHKATGAYVDLRLVGYPGSNAQRRGSTYEFQPSSAVKVIYEQSGESLKDYVVLNTRSIDVLRYDLSAPDLTATEQGNGEITFGNDRDPALFTIEPSKAWDATGKVIPSTLRLEGAWIVVRLGRRALANAVLPVTVDPTITGAPANSTSRPEVRQLFQTADSRLVFFYSEATETGGQIVYRTSSDQGNTWSAATVIVATYTVQQLAVAKTADDAFHVVYVNGPADVGIIAYRLLTPSGSTWTVGLQKTVATIGTAVSPIPAVLDRGGSGSARQAMVGFRRFDAVNQWWEYVTATTADSGEAWTTPVACGTNVAEATIAIQGTRLHCFLPWAGAAGLAWREYNGTAWGSSTQIPTTEVDGMPSTAVTSDGRLHLVVGINEYADPSTGYTSLPSGGSTWATMKAIGPGLAPVVTTTGDVVYAYSAESTEFMGNSRIRAYFSVDSGTTWREHPSLGGSTFDYVIDSQNAWDLTTSAGDALFSVSDATGAVGNLIGEESVMHRLDLPTKKAAFRFKTTTSGAAVQIKLWAKASGNTEYRIGLKSSDAVTGAPSSAWLNEQWLGGQLIGGAFTVYRPQIMASPTLVTLSIPQTTLSAATKYHVVVEPTNEIGYVPGPTAWFEVEAISAYPGAEGDTVVHREGTPWTLQSGQVGHFVVSSANGKLGAQEITPQPAVPAFEWNVPGEDFVAPRTMPLSSVRAYMGKIGMPNDSVTFRILSGSNEIWTSEITPVQGWNSISVSGVTLSGGARYKLLVDSRVSDPANYWTLGSSGDANASWDGTISTFTSGLDRPGLTDKTLESSDDVWAFDDFWAFNGGGSEAVYFGAAAAFGHVSSYRGLGDTGAAVPLSWSYWNGSAWATLPTTHDEFGAGGDTTFVPPSDWKETELDNVRALWIKATSTSGSATPIYLERVDAIKDYSAPTVPPRSSGGLPLAYRDGEAQAIQFELLPLVREQSAALGADEVLGQAWEALGVSITLDVISAGPVTKPNQVILGDAILLTGQIQTRRSNAQPTYRTLQVVSVGCPTADAAGTLSSENSVTRGSAGENANPTTYTRFIFIPSETGSVTCTLKGKSQSVAIQPTQDGNLVALSGVENTTLTGRIISSGSGQDEVLKRVVPKSDAWTLVASLTAPIPANDDLTVIGDLNLTTCTNDAPDQTLCPVTGDAPTVTPQSRLTITFANPVPENCQGTVNLERTEIHTNIHHRKLRNSITRSLVQLAGCGATMLIELHLRVIAGDVDGVQIDEDPLDPEDPLNPPQFSVILRAVG